VRPISARVKKILLADPRMKRCALAPVQDLYEPCDGRIEFEHAWIYAGRQIDEPWAIIGVCSKHHKMKDGDRAVKAAIETASLMLATDEDLAQYPRKNWQQIRRSLGL
jgi:hypothetical protein